MKLTHLAVYRPVVALTVTVALIIAGIASYFTLGLELNPQVTVPIVTVNTPYPGASADAVEETVTRPLEDAIAGLGGVKTITSNSQTNVSIITVEFQEGTDVDVAASDVQQRVSGVRRTLPADVEDPSYAKLDFNDVPVLDLAVTTAGNPDEVQLHQIANDVVRPSLETVGGVGRVVIVGGQEPEVHVDIQTDRLNAFSLTVDDVATAVRTQFLNTAGGRFTSGGGDRQAPVRVDTQAAGLDALRGVSVAVPPTAGAATGSPQAYSVMLENVANVYLGGKEADQRLRVNGRQAAGLLVYKQSNANITQTVDALMPRIDQINQQLPSGYRLETIIDTSTIIRRTVRGVGEELLLAAIITGVVLFFFLHSVRSTLIVLIAIPVSLLIALIVMKITGLTLNNISLIALTTAIGVLVDDSIVVLENIHSHLERGEEPLDAAIEGRSEIGMAAIAITMVDVAVWGPIIVLTGIVGAFLRSFAIVMVAAVLASLLVSFTLTPLIASRWLTPGEETSRAARLAMVWEPVYRLLARGYQHLLGWALHHRPLVILAAVLVFGANFLVVPLLGTEFVPETNSTSATIVGELPPGTALDASNRAAIRWESVLLDKQWFPEVQTVFTQVGRAEADQDPRLITITLDVGAPSGRIRTSQQIARAAAEAGAQLVPTLRTRTGGTGQGQPLQLRVFANDLNALGQLATQAQMALARRPELVDVTNSLALGPEVVVVPDPARLRDLGLTAQTISGLARVALEGVVVGTWTDASGQQRDIRVELPPDARSNADTLQSLPLVQRQGQPIRVRQVASTISEEKPTKITRVNRQRTATLGAEPNGVPLGTATAAATQTLNALALPAGARWDLAGQASDQQESFRQLGLGLGASVLLMFFILSILYENWLQPLLIQTALPLATVGAFLGLLAFHQTLSLPSFIGLIALFGLVGKNAILLVDRANHLRHEGLDRTEALEQAGQSRFRPILMTSAVLIFSMLPVALRLGEGGETRAPLGAVLVGGMATSTLLSLIYVPVAYTYFDSFGALLVRLVRRPPKLPAYRAPVQRAVDGRHPPPERLYPHLVKLSDAQRTATSR